MDRKIYLDNAATTPMFPQVADLMVDIMREDYGNPSSTHFAGRKAKVVLEEARIRLAGLLGVSPSEIIFTSGGSESDNTVLRGAAQQGIRRILSSPLEHHAVTSTLEILQKQGMEICYLEHDNRGNLDMSSLESLLGKKTPTLVCLMHANNETGNQYGLKKIGELCHRAGALFHTDAVQSIGHYRMNIGALPVDYLSASAHKFHGPKGVGFLYVRKGCALPPLISGGMQEREYRAGTENVGGIAGMVKALEMTYQTLEKDTAYITGLKQLLIDKLEQIEGIRFNGNCYKMESSLYNIVNVTLPVKKNAQMTLFSLDIAGIALSGGSACMSGAWQQSHVITCLWGNDELYAGCPTLRISLSKFNTEQEIEIAVRHIADICRR